MATYAIGDVHGCFETLQGLLGRIAFDAQRSSPTEKAQPTAPPARDYFT